MLVCYSKIELSTFLQRFVVFISQGEWIRSVIFATIIMHLSLKYWCLLPSTYYLHLCHKKKLFAVLH